MAVCLLDIGDDDDKDNGEAKKQRLEEAANLMARIPGLRQKIVGKSIPLEVRYRSLIPQFPILTNKQNLLQKLVTRKSRKFQSQNRYLALPALELTYLFHGIAHAPRTVITNKMLPQVDILLMRLSQSKDDINRYVGGRYGYWDDFCLRMFLKGVCMRYVAYPVSLLGCCVL